MIRDQISFAKSYEILVYTSHHTRWSNSTHPIHPTREGFQFQIMIMIMLIILMMIQICFRGGHLTSRLSLKELNDRLEKYIGSMDMLPQSPNHTITRWTRWWWSWQGWSWSWWYDIKIMMISKWSLRNMEMLPWESPHHAAALMMFILMIMITLIMLIIMVLRP